MLEDLKENIDTMRRETKEPNRAFKYEKYNILLRHVLCGINSRFDSIEKAGEFIYKINSSYPNWSTEGKNEQSFCEYRTEFSEVSSFHNFKLALAQRDILREIWREGAQAPYCFYTWKVDWDPLGAVAVCAHCRGCAGSPTGPGKLLAP